MLSCGCRQLCGMSIVWKKIKRSKIMKLFRNRQDGQGDDPDACPPGFVNVFLYEDQDDHTNLTGRFLHYDENHTCEEICKEIAVQTDMTPTMLHCFGISIYDPMSKTFAWLQPKQRLNNVRYKNDSCELHFRMRFLPHKAKLDNLQKFDVASFRYLFAQVTRDFLKDCLPCFSSSDKTQEVRGISVLLMMGKMRQDTEKSVKNVDNIKKLFKNFDSFLPASINKSLLKGRTVLKDSMKKEVEKLVERFKLGTVNSLYIWRSWLNHILDINQAYYEEMYTAFDIDIDVEQYESVDGEPPDTEDIEKLSICVEMGQTGQRLIVSTERTDGCYKIDLIDLTNLIIEQYKDWWSVKMFRQNGHPKVIYFNDELTAYSFLSCLECYCRCVYDYYSSLCSEIQHSNHDNIMKIRSHGLVSDNYVKRILLKRNSKDLYIVRMNPDLFDVFDVLYLPNQNGKLKSTSLPKIIRQDDGYIIEGSSDTPVDIKILMNRLIQNSTLLQACDGTQMQSIKPASDGCDLLRDILFEKFKYLLDEEDEERQRERKRQENQPKVFMEVDVKKTSLIGSGYFTEARYGMLLEKDLIVVKEVRIKEIHERDFCSIYQEFQAGFQKLMTLYEPKYFVPYYGVCLGSTPCMLIGGTNHGSLRHFLQYREPVPVLSFHHLLEVTVQVASALEHMMNINCYHGNLNCDNLSVMEFDERYLIVKITDPGLVSLYNQLPIEHEVNQARVPWLAPELHSDLSAINIQTEVYSYGTTLWQMFSGGRSPLQYDPKLLHLNATGIRQFFASGNDILTCPDTLKIQEADPKEIQDLKTQLYETMVSCWKLDPEERMEPKRILRGLNCSMQSYGEIYHKYNEISYITYDVGMSASVGTDDLSTQRKLSSGFNTTHVSVPDISVLRKDRNEETAGPSLPPLPPVPLPLHLIEDMRIKIKEEIGHGHYGQVFKGELMSLDRPTNGHIPKPQIVVVKKLKKEMRDKCEAELKKEAAVMAPLSHPNIVQFLGMSVSGVYLVMEYVDNNSLIKYVKGERIRKQVPFIKLAVDITSGLKYLEDNKILHCDLAARNILLTRDLHAKISDFGLSKVLPDEKYYYRKHEDQILPIPWCSPEVIEERGKFTSKSDVWSFGVVLWEMYSYGDAPVLAKNVRDILKRLQSGKRLPKPTDCPDHIYIIMKQCWNIERDLRPSFQELNQQFKGMMSAEAGTIPKASSEIKNVGNINGLVTGSPSAISGLPSVMPVPCDQSCANRNVIIDHKDLVCNNRDILGKGFFGKVMKGSHKGNPVAIKQCTVDKEYGRFRREYELLFELRNNSQNIVKFIGICKSDNEGQCNGQRYMYVMEYMENGCLYQYLVRQKSIKQFLTLQRRLQFLIDIARGMDCLFQKSIVHCDLTAKNILLDTVLTCKISDFGWAKKLDSDESNCQYQRKDPQMQVLWTAPECFNHHRYNKYSDIWSYGVVGIEVFKDGETPCPDIPYDDLQKDKMIHNERVMKAINEGRKYPRPGLCPDDIYTNVLMKCWSLKPEERIVYSDILDLLNRKKVDCISESVV
ncbi:hypothetical protein ACF0H5_019983 [Mactra antiquata]